MCSSLWLFCEKRLLQTSQTYSFFVPGLLALWRAAAAWVPTTEVALLVDRSRDWSAVGAESRGMGLILSVIKCVCFRLLKVPVSAGFIHGWPAGWQVPPWLCHRGSDATLP